MLSLRAQISCAVWLITFLLAVAISTHAHAQTVVNAEPGEALRLELTEKPITDPAAKYGKLQIIENVDGARRALVYLAPSDLSDFRDDVSYKLDGESKALKISVNAGVMKFGNEEVYERSFQAIFILFILAVVVESGLQLIFRWRPYVRNFDTSGVNALVAFGFSFLLVQMFNLDIATQLVNAYTSPAITYPSSTVGSLLTAMIIAGGSAGVNRVFRGFGFRPIELPAEISGPRDETIAWISVMLDRNNAHGPVNVLFGDEANPSVIGTIKGNQLQWPLFHYFIRNPGRFPQSGGFAVAVKSDQILKLVGTDVKGNVVEGTWGPFNVGPRAIIDVEMNL